MTLTITRVGRRSYIGGQTFSFRDALRSVGAHWDAERKAWWLGKHDEAVALVEKLSAKAPQTDEARKAEMLERDRGAILGRATCDGKSHYLVGEGRRADGSGWVRLMIRDGSATFFRAAAEVVIEKRYREPMSLHGLQEFAARKKREAETGECECRCHNGGYGRYGSGGHSLFDGCDYCGCEDDG